MEQICKWHLYGKRGVKRPGLYEQFLKKQAARQMRRLAKRDPEDAPKRYRYRGYSD